MNPTADIDCQAPTVWTNEEGAVWHLVWGPTHRRAIKAERNVTVSLYRQYNDKNRYNDNLNVTKASL